MAGPVVAVATWTEAQAERERLMSEGRCLTAVVVYKPGFDGTGYGLAIHDPRLNDDRPLISTGRMTQAGGGSDRLVWRPWDDGRNDNPHTIALAQLYFP